MKNYNDENTVSASGQMKNSDVLRYYGNAQSKNRILIVGNSITRHGRLPSIGWDNDWGMAASKEENDYVHLIMTALTNANIDFYLCVRQASSWEVSVNENKQNLEEFKEIQDFKCNILIFRLGENVSGNIDKDYFYNSLNEYISYISNSNTKTIYTTSFWENNAVNESIRKYSLNNNGLLVELEDLGQDSSNKAYGLFAHSGVSAHPGDKGMRLISQRILEKLLNLF